MLVGRVGLEDECLTFFFTHDKESIRTKLLIMNVGAVKD